MSFGSVTGYLSGGLIDPSTPNYAGAAAKNEKSRQAQINQGLGAINSVYNGGSYNYYAQAGGKGGASGFDPSQNYYSINSKTRGYTPFGGGLKREQELYKKGKLSQQFTSPTYAGFNPNFYNQAAQDYVQYAVPQVAQQYNEARKSIDYGLANRGLYGGSAQQKANSDLNLNVGQQEQSISDNARTTATNLQSQVQSSQQNAINNLYQSADPSGAAASAVQSAAQFNVPQSFTPILNAFSGLANQYATSQLYNNYTPTQYGGAPQQSAPFNWSSALGPTTY